VGCKTYYIIIKSARFKYKGVIGPRESYWGGFGLSG